jgi:LPXTG-motif cell wall-anchored protein
MRTADPIDGNLQGGTRRLLALLSSVLLLAGLVVLATDSPGDALAGVRQSPNCGSTIGLANGDFETPAIAAGQSSLTPTGTAGLIWNNSVENVIEQWSTGFQGRRAFSGAQFVEMNAYQAGSLYQDLATVPGSVMVWRIAHMARDRDGETMRVRIGAAGSAPNSTSPALVANLVGPDRNGWTIHSGNYTVPAGQTTTRFAFESDVTTTSAPGSGNFLDAIEFAFTAGACSDSSTTNAGSAVTIDVLGNDIGAGLSIASIDASAGGTATIVGDRVRFAPTAGFSGAGSFAYTVRDAAGNTSTATSTVTVLPVGVDDTIDTTEVTAVTIPVLTNDLGTAKTITGVTTPAHGAATVISGRTAISYRPVAGFLGTDTFTYRGSADGGTYEATVTVHVTASADLAIGFGVITTSPLAGTEISVPVLVTNDGPSTAGGTATISLPVGLSFVSGAGCTAVARVVTCPVPSMFATGFTSYRLLLRTTIDGTLTLNGQVTGPVADPNVLNNVAARSIVVRPAADLTVNGTVSPAPLVPGATGTWSFTTTNDGPSTAAASQIVVTVDPAQLDAPRSASPGCTEAPAGTFTCALGPLTAGESATTTISGVINASVTTTVSASAAVSTTTTDPVPGNNNDVVSDATSPTADLAVTATAGATTVDPGGDAGFTFSVRNLGPSVAREVVLTIPVPTTLLITGLPDNCTADEDNLVTCDIGLLDVSGGGFTDTSGDLVISGVVDPASGTSLDLTATSTMTPSITDPVPGNNSATASSTVDVRADLAITESLSHDPPVPGLDADLRVTVENIGPAVADTPVITISVPTGFTPISTAAPSCVISTPTTLICTLDELVSGTHHTIAVSGRFAQDATGPVTFTAGVTSSTPDPVLSNNTVTRATTLAPEADLEITGTAPELFPVGTDVSWSFTVENLGPSSTDGFISLQLTLPPGAVLTSVTELFPGHGAPPTYGGPVSCDATLLCSVGALSAGESIDLTVVTDLRGVAPGAVAVTGEVSSAATDPDLSNNTITLVSGAVEPPIDPEPPVTPPDPVDPGQLPYTGTDSTAMLLAGATLLGGGLLLCGAVAILGRSRRRPS